MKRKMKEYIVTIISRKQKQEIQLKATNKKEAKEMVIDVITNTYLFKNQKLNNIKIEKKRLQELMHTVIDKNERNEIAIKILDLTREEQEIKKEGYYGK